jgi:hypothetical protein
LAIAKVSKALTPSPSPVGEGNKKILGFSLPLLWERDLGGEGSM